jgi:hypothetical protein
VGEFCREDHGPARIIDQGHSRRTTPWIDLDAQWLHLWRLYCMQKHDGKRKALEDGCFPCGEQYARSTRMDRVQRLFLRVNDKDM